MRNQQFTIEEAFKTCVYIVPDYQREYVWKEEHVSQLLEDINEQIDASSSEYFIGTVLVSPTKHRNQFEVIDGQQRLTTMFLILCALRVLFTKKEMPLQSQELSSLTATSYTDPQGEIRRTFKLILGYENAREVIEELVKSDGEPQAIRKNIESAGISTKSGSTENILTAYDVIYRYLTVNYGDETKLKEYWGHLAHRITFIQIQDELSRALKIFETINERGVGLNPMDLLKNLLFKLVDPENFSRLRDEWKKITNPLEKAKEKPLRFLRYFLMANYVINNDRNKAIVREDEIYNWFSKTKNAEQTEYKAAPFKFVQKIIRNVDRYIEFRSEPKPSLVMDSLERLTGKAFSLHYVLLLAAADLPKALFDHFVSQLESFLFYYIFTVTPTRELERDFSVWADEVREIVKIEDQSEQLNALDQFITKRFKDGMDRKSQELDDALNRLEFGSMQKYRMRYLLARLTQYADMQFTGVKTRGSLGPYFNLEIEHILPINPKLELRRSWEDKHPGKDYEEYKNKLGNLTLLEKPINVVAGNDFYSSKKIGYAKSGHYLTRSLSNLADVGHNTSIVRLNKHLHAFTNWGAEEIEERQRLLIELVHEVW